MFEWSDKFIIGNEEIDSQHKKLFEIGEAIWRTLKSSSEIIDDKVLHLFDELRDYSVYHFNCEEEILKLTNHTLNNNHIKQHKDFIHRVSTLKTSSMADNQLDTLFETLNFIADWIINHILETDINGLDKNLLGC